MPCEVANKLALSKHVGFSFSWRIPKGVCMSMLPEAGQRAISMPFMKRNEKSSSRRVFGVDDSLDVIRQKTVIARERGSRENLIT